MECVPVCGSRPRGVGLPPLSGAGIYLSQDAQFVHGGMVVRAVGAPSTVGETSPSNDRDHILRDSSAQRVSSGSLVSLTTAVESMVIRCRYRTRRPRHLFTLA